MSIYKHCYCVKCNKKLTNIDDRDNQVQPQDGVAFITYGHYGSTFFDPCNGDYLQIVLCDECFKMLDKRKKLVYNISNNRDE